MGSTSRHALSCTLHVLFALCAVTLAARGVRLTPTSTIQELGSALQLSSEAQNNAQPLVAAGQEAYEALLDRLSVPQPLLTADVAPRGKTLVRSTSAGGSDFDMEESQTYAKLVSVAYCSNSSVINAWNCAR